eukprot:SAG22_NODE_7230_length_759_cov_2.174242_1_plen_71_part_10
MYKYSTARDRPPRRLSGPGHPAQAGCKPHSHPQPLRSSSARSTFFLDPLGRSEVVERCGGGSVPPVEIRAV